MLLRYNYKKKDFHVGIINLLLSTNGTYNFGQNILAKTEICHLVEVIALLTPNMA